MPSFYFEQVLQTALNGIDQNVTGPVLQLAGVILILSLLYAVYEAYSNGGDVRALGIAGIKYLVLGIVFLNYQQAFRSVNGMFNSVADFIYNTNGIGDVIQNWLNALSTYVGQQGLSSFWTLACSWCDHEGSRLMLVPYPQSSVRIRSFRYPQEAEIIGRVTGIAQLIAELHSEVSV